ncbi:hypothetical protein ABB37_02642 [Leptomonas pyrrhocoris]|uniref:RING-type domain-containing protein n=1 Tax=Leptomonas pyrrhocoris TaxID=157538 RepID=A0A0M9G5Q4_LEPPY|nr:hypothetical protein ABB37_02642 [Leptomonas pyrrhocoris]KPA82883.1 hypothetical protein ABB37_02642 [Leptomonas pyrrhocoris]|eukprot:XP_015661322.1 hypothetical protein ABB37_02642 [Leptomonas pyrrhocoris]
MAGLQSQNISVASTKLPGPSTSDRDVCVFCHRRATPVASDPHAPLFPFFSLVDCRHYACQPCALVHCDNAGRCISCPQCNCVSRLAQSGRRRDYGSAPEADRVFIDDGVSSVRSHRSATVRPSPHRSALKGQSGSSKKRASSVQFPANPTTSIVAADKASTTSNAHENAAAAEEGEGQRATSPLTQDAVDALPIDPSEARRKRVREQQQRRAAAAAAQAEKSVSLYAITAEPPKPLSTTLSGDAAQVAPSRRSKDRSRSQPTPKLPNTILEPKQVFPVPPPLVLHTIDEDEPAATVTAGGDAATNEAAKDAPEDNSSTSVSVSKPSVSPRDNDHETEPAAQTSEAAPVASSPLDRAQLEDCEAAESEARGVLDAVEEHERRKLRQSMEEAETAIHARRGLEVEFASTPLPSQPEQPLTDLSDQVSATSDDELSQRSSAHKSGGGSLSRRKHRTPRSSVADGEVAGGAAAPTTAATGNEAQKGPGEPQPKADTPANAPSATRPVAGTASSVGTPSPMTAARAARPTEAEEEAQAKAKLDAAEAQKREMQQQQEERYAFARHSLEERETLERDAQCKTEAAVRAHYVRNAEEWRTALIPHALEAQRRARDAADAARQQQQQLAQLQADENADRANVANEEADEWAWIVSGACVDRVVAATEESERVQREYKELRYERLQRQFQHDAAQLVEEEQLGRRALEEFEATSRDLLQSSCHMQRDVAVAEEERLRREAAHKSAARREAAAQQRCQREREDLAADEVEGRAIVREEEREERRTANMVFVQGVAAVRRRELIAGLTNNTPYEETGEKEEEAPTTEKTGRVPSVALARQTAPGEWSVNAEAPTATATVADRPSQQADSPRISAEQLEELHLRQAQHEEEMRAAMQRLREAERRVAEEAAIRARAEEERRASQAESERLVREAEQRAEQRIRDARDAAERLMQAQLSDVRDEAARRAEHAAVMQSLAEEEQRAVLEAKLQAAERQLELAQQRAAEELQRERDEAAAMAAAEAARTAHEAQRREAEWQERARAEKLLRLSEQENEKADAIRRLGELEARAAEAVRLAREEAARSAAAMEERIAEMERRQQAREVEVQQASQRVRSAQDSMRDFDSRSQSSLHTTPLRAEGRVAILPQTSSLRPSRHASVSIATTPSRSDRLLAASASASAVVPASVVSPGSRHSIQTPPLAPSPTQTSSLVPRVTSVQQHQQQQASASSAAEPQAENASTPPRVMLGAGASTPLSAHSAQPTSLSHQRIPLPASSSPAAAASASGAGLYNFDPADVVRAAIREAVMEIVAAQQQAQLLHDQAEQHAELSERRFQRRESDRMRAAHEVAELESSHVRSEMSVSPHYPPSRQRTSDRTPSLGSERVHGGRNEETPLAYSSVSSPAGAAVPVPSATAAAPGFVIGNAMSSTSSVYFDDQPYWTAGDGRGSTASAAAPFTRGPPPPNQYRYEPFVPWKPHPQSQTAAPAAQPRQAASRVLFPTHRAHSQGAAVGAHAGQDLRRGDGGYPLPSSHAGGGGGGHAYNEPEPSKPASVIIEYSPPPPRRSTTRAAAEGERPYAAAGAPAATTNTAVTSTGALPQASQVCPRCYRADATSPCWRCGEMICRHCGLRQNSARKLCCSAHLRAQLRDYARQQQYPKVSQSLRGNQQVQTSFRTSTDASDSVNNSPGALSLDAPDRYDAGTSTWRPQEPPSMIPPAAYYRPAPPFPPQPPQPQHQENPQQYYFDHPGLYANPVSVAAMTAGEPIAYPSGNPRMPHAYPCPYPTPAMQPQWSWQPMYIQSQPQPLQQQQQQQQQQPAGLTQTPPPQVPLPAAPSQPAPQRVADVAVEEDKSSRGSQPPRADSAAHRVPASSQDGCRRTGSASSRSSAAASAPSAAVRITPRPESNPEAAGSASARPAPGPTTPVRSEGAEQQKAQAVPLSSTPDESQPPLQDPKTERKRTAAAFFVPLGGGGAEEPRRPKPPTPCNYVPSKLFPPDAVRAAAATFAKANPKKVKRPSPSPPAANSRMQSGVGRRASPPLRTPGVRAALHDPYAARVHNARPPRASSPAAAPQRRASPGPYGHPRRTSADWQPTRRQPTASPRTQPRPTVRADAPEPQPVLVSYMKAVAPMHPRFAEVRKDRPAAASRSTQPQPPSASSDSYSPYTTSTSSTSQPQVDKRARNEPLVSQQRREDEASRGHRFQPTSQPHPHREHGDPNRQARADAAGSLPQRPLQHRYAPRWSDPSTVSFNAPERRVPTLAELDSRLQKLRAQDEYEAAQYQQRQSRLGRNTSPQQRRPSYPSVQPQVHVLLETPGGAPPPLHRPRSPQQRTASPPWRTDLNSSPLRPRWDISRPHSPVYHPPVTTVEH